MKQNLKKFYPLICILLLFFVLCTYLPFSNTIYSYFAGGTGFVAISKEQLKEYDTRQKITAYLDALKVLRDAFREDLKPYGYGYIPTQSESDNRHVKIILASTENSYESSINLCVREDLLNSMKSRNIQHTSSNLGIGGIGAWAGAGESLNLLAVAKGQYRVGIYVYENEQEYGICWMPIYVKKTAWGGAEIYYGEQISNFEGLEKSDTAKATLLAVEGQKDYFYIPGYAYDTEIGPNNQNIYVEFTAEDGNKRTVLALNTDSTGLDYFPDASYTENSFSAYMPKAEVGDGIYDVRVYIEDQANGAIVYASESVWRFKDGQTELYTGELVENFPKVEDSITSHAAILTVWYLDQSYYYIPGYAYDTEVGANNQTVYLELEDSKGERITYKALTTDSTGIDYFPDNTYTRNSFTAKIPEELIPDGTYAIRTIIQDKSSGRVVYAPGALNCAISQDEIVFQ